MYDIEEYCNALSVGDVSSNMPITGVILYDNGYAVFERQTLVHGHSQIDLYFRIAAVSWRCWPQCW